MPSGYMIQYMVTAEKGHNVCRAAFRLQINPKPTVILRIAARRLKTPI